MRTSARPANGGRMDGLHDVQSFRGVRNPARSQNARFSLAHRLAATFPGAGNASRKPETTVTEATTAGRGDNCGEVHNGRGRVGPRGLNRPPCSTKSSSAGCEWRIVVAVLISRSEEHTSELQSHSDLVCRLLL